MDFTFTTYTRLLNSLRSRGYSCQTVEGFIRAPRKKTVILRHDVDKLPANALRIARLKKSFVHESTRICANEGSIIYARLTQ